MRRDGGATRGGERISSADEEAQVVSSRWPAARPPMRRHCEIWGRNRMGKKRGDLGCERRRKTAPFSQKSKRKAVPFAPPSKKRTHQTKTKNLWTRNVERKETGYSH
jgi:hypothetical protein